MPTSRLVARTTLAVSVDFHPTPKQSALRNCDWTGKVQAGLLLVASFGKTVAQSTSLMQPEGSQIRKCCDRPHPVIGPLALRQG